MAVAKCIVITWVDGCLAAGTLVSSGPAFALPSRRVIVAIAVRAVKAAHTTSVARRCRVRAINAVWLLHTSTAAVPTNLVHPVFVGTKTLANLSVAIGTTRSTWHLAAHTQAPVSFVVALASAYEATVRVRAYFIFMCT